MLLGLASGLTRQGHEVVVYSRSGPNVSEVAQETLRLAAAAGIEPRVFHRRTRPSRLPFYPGRDRMLSVLAANEDRLQLMVIHGMFGALSGRIARTCEKAGIPSIACPHDPYSPELFGTRAAAKRIYWRLFEAPFLRRTRAIHVLAPSHIAYLRSLGIPTPCFVVPNGLDADWLESASRDESDRPRPQAHDDAELLLVFLGRWDVYNKGLDLLLRALAQDQVVRSTSKLLIAGRAKDGERHQLQRLISSLRLEERVSLLGYLEDRQQLVRSADALILPSRFDGFGQVVLEAIAAGTPAIVSSKAGASEFLGPEHGVVVVEPTVSELVQGIRTLTTSLARLRTSARSSGDYLARGFTWDRLALNWTEEVIRLGIVDTSQRA
jgi:glycosyltransferase involved in cell wall biosynthesis